MKTELKDVSLKELYELFPDQEGAITELIERDGVDAIVIFENLEMTSAPRPGPVAVAVGFMCDLATEADVQGTHIGQVPSQFRYPVKIYRKEDSNA